LEINRLKILGSVNIGLYAKANNNFLIYYSGITSRKVKKLINGLKVEPIPIKPLNTRIISPFIALNSRGLIISRYLDLDLKDNIKSAIKGKDLELVELDTKYTAIGNLVIINDHAALTSPILPNRVRREIADKLDVEVSSITIGRFSYIGSLMVVNNIGGLAAPVIKEDELNFIRSLFKIDVLTGTVNNGIYFVSSGIILNDKAIYVGENTVGRELLLISQAFSR